MAALASYETMERHITYPSLPITWDKSCTCLIGLLWEIHKIIKEKQVHQGLPGKELLPTDKGPTWQWAKRAQHSASLSSAFCKEKIFTKLNFNYLSNYYISIKAQHENVYFLSTLSHSSPFSPRGNHSCKPLVGLSKGCILCIYIWSVVYCLTGWLAPPWYNFFVS